MFQSCLTKQLIETNILPFIEPKRVLITRSFRLPGISVCLFTIAIHIWLKKGSRLGSGPGLAERAPLSDKGTARCFLAKTKIRGGKFFVKTLKNLRYGFRGRVCSRCNITTVRAPKQTLGADWSGLERTSEPRYFSRLYLAA